MLYLHGDTPPTWIEAALADVDTVLLDHAHCEKKAASTAINLIFRYTQHVSLVEPLSQLSRQRCRQRSRLVLRSISTGSPQPSADGA